MTGWLRAGGRKIAPGGEEKGKEEKKREESASAADSNYILQMIVCYERRAMQSQL